MTYGELGKRVARIATMLLAQQEAAGVRGQPVLLLFAPGPAYVSAIFACILAGLPAVPAYPPDPARPQAGLRRLSRLVSDARAACVACDSRVASAISLLGLDAQLPDVVEVPDDPDEAACDDVPPAASASSIAVIQYTSGTTGSPRGIVIRHENLEHNIGQIVRFFGLSEASRGMVWLPPYHDMGLVGGVLTPLFVGFPVRLMSPLDFLKRPTAWLRQVSEMGATVSGGPNFAYDLCLRRRIPEADLAALDLSRWEVAFNGAEPVRGQTMEAFARTFARAGFRRSAFFPCYGLAEATLIVTGRHWDGSSGPGVSCGSPAPDQELRIADPVTGRVVDEGREGEIWVRGPSTTSGYWGEGDDAELFGSHDGVRYLRTGDLGFVRDGQLVITGRRKAVLVHRGRNHHAADVEAAATSSLEGLRPVAAAFMVEREEEEAEPCLVIEARPVAGAPAAVARAVRAHVLGATGLRLGRVAVVPPTTIPRTSSGKVERGSCREAFLAGEYERFVTSDAQDARDGGVSADDDVSDRLTGVVAGVFAGACETAGCGPDDSLLDLGGDSVRAAEIAAVLEQALTLEVPVEVVLQALTPRATAEALLARWHDAGRTGPELAARFDELADDHST